MKNQKKVDPNAPTTFIKVAGVDNGGKIKEIEYGYEIYSSEKDGNHCHYYIPGFNIFFFAKTEEERDKKADAAMTAFFNHWVKNQGKIAFLEELGKLGFKETKNKSNRRYRLPINRTGIPSAFSRKASEATKIAA